ncbi:MAG TPA: hypothetical protein VHF91_07700 [Acidimicrobiales bacterium]|nr:hypothetical protein [Acidimicrobiales bacterium]
MVLLRTFQGSSRYTGANTSNQNRSTKLRGLGGAGRPYFCAIRRCASIIR